MGQSTCHYVSNSRNYIGGRYHTLAISLLEIGVGHCLSVSVPGLEQCKPSAYHQVLPLPDNTYSLSLPRLDADPANQSL